MFDIQAKQLFWINHQLDDPHDLCAHGDISAIIEKEVFTYECTASAAALYLLRSLTQNHIAGQTRQQFLPCCGHTMIAQNDTLDTVEILGCSNGIDWSIIHEDKETIRIITVSGKETHVPITQYRTVIFHFADSVETFYQQCTPKIMPKDKFEQDGYTAFWNEWHRLRYTR